MFPLIIICFGGLMQLYENEKILIPCLIIWGSEDAALRVDLNKNIKKVVPNSEFYEIKEGSHFIQQDRPDAVNKLMHNFLLKTHNQ